MMPSAPRTYAAALALLLSAMAPKAHAKATAVSPYTLQQTYGAALRLLRVDLGLEVTEKDDAAAYLLFRYRAGDETKRIIDGAIELIALGNDIKVVVKIPSLPEAHERLLRDRLVKKMREDYGDPPKRPAPAKPPEPPKPAEPAPPNLPEPGRDEKPKT